MLNITPQELLDKYYHGQCSEEELACVEGWIADRTSKISFKRKYIPKMSAKRRIWRRVMGLPEDSFFTMYKGRIAAAILILLMPSSGYVVYKAFMAQPKSELLAASVINIQPGGNRATLEVANGAKINLSIDPLRLKLILNGLNITQSDSGSMIVYRQINAPQFQHTSADTNILSTAPNGQYQVILPDGSKVYLNSSSSLRYPVHFAANERRVTLTGEGYFEISKNEKQPFVVQCTGQTLKVIGTHFNVNVYDKDSIRTTLVEGLVSVKQSATGRTEMLTPDKQSIVTKKNVIVRKVNAASYINWKDGLFSFDNTPVKEALRQISVWYNVAVDYESLPEKNVSGPLQRKLSFEEMLKFFEGMDIYLTCENGIIKAK